MNHTKLTAFTAAIFVVFGPPVLRAGAPAVAGAQRRWALDFRVRLEQPGGERPIEVDLSGDWVSTITAVRSGEYDAALELANARIRGEGGSAPADGGEQLRQRLGRRFWATYREDGALVMVHFYKDTDPADRNLLQTIATECQFVRSGAEPFAFAASRAAWTVLERDGAGQYLAIYGRSLPDGVVKRKLKYIRTDGAPGVPANGIHVDIEQSELHFSLDANGEIQSMDGRNQVRLAIPFGDAGRLTTVTEIHLAGLTKSDAPALIGSLQEALAKVVTLPVVTHKPDPDQLRAEADDQLIEGRTTESLLDAALAKKDDPILADRLAALFRRRADAPAAAFEILRKNGAARRITDALGRAGSPQAIAVLGRVVEDQSLPQSLRIDGLSALILVQHPSAEAMRLPLALVDDQDAHLASAARIVSGSLARAGRTVHRPEADALDAALVARYRKARDVEQASNLLAALGNSAGPSVLRAIEEALGDSSNPVRAEAARALRFAEGPEIDGLLARAITEDHDSGVRAAAVFAASFRHPIGPKVAAALTGAARSDSSEQVRQRAATVLQRNLAPGR